MIHVVYHRKYHRLTVEGHAQSGEAGHDLVCASASILTYTLGAAVQNMAAGGQVTSPITTFESGHAEVWCKSPHRLRAAVTLTFDTVCAGFELLAKKYPGNISYRIMG